MPYTVPTEFRNLSCGEVISKFVDKCGEYGMLVMLDNHRLDEQNIPDLVRPHAAQLGGRSKKTACLGAFIVMIR